MNWNLGSLCVSVILNTAGGLLIKQSSKVENKFDFIVIFLGAGFSFFTALIFYSYALRKISLNFAQPFVAGLGLIGIVMMSWLLFGEKLNFYGLVGVFFIIIGIILVAS